MPRRNGCFFTEFLQNFYRGVMTGRATPDMLLLSDTAGYNLEVLHRTLMRAPREAAAPRPRGPACLQTSRGWVAAGWAAYSDTTSETVACEAKRRILITPTAARQCWEVVATVARGAAGRACRPGMVTSVGCWLCGR